MARHGYTYQDRQRTTRTSGAAAGAVIVPIALIAGGLLLWKRATRVVEIPDHEANALPGMSGFGSSFKKAVKKGTKVLTKVSPSAALAHQIVKKTGGGSNPMQAMSKIDPVKNLHKSPVFSKTALVRKLRPRGSPRDTTQPAPGQAVVYKDINGKVITEAEYRALDQAVNSGQPVQLGEHWALPAGYIITAAQYAAMTPGSSGTLVTHPPSGSGSGTSYTSIYTPEGSAPNDPSSGPNQGGSTYDLGPEAPAVQQYAPATADVPAPAVADRKFNPLLAVGAMIAVPVVMGLTGGR